MLALAILVVGELEDTVQKFHSRSFYLKNGYITQNTIGNVSMVAKLRCTSQVKIEKNSVNIN